MYIRIKKLREIKKISSKELASILNISETLYLSYETGKKQIPVHILSKLSIEFNTSIDYLIGSTDEIIPHKKSSLKS